jgi:hypothetical protein
MTSVVPSSAARVVNRRPASTMRTVDAVTTVYPHERRIGNKDLLIGAGVVNA